MSFFRTDVDKHSVVEVICSTDVNMFSKIKDRRHKHRHGIASISIV